MTFNRTTSYVLLAVILLLFVPACKSKKKMMEAAAAQEKLRTEEAARKQREEALMKEAEEKERKRLEEERALALKQQAEEELRNSTPAVKLNKYFQSIAAAPSVASANGSINEALTLFASPNAPVLIVISEEGSIKDYDKPTTIKDYLNYLKDQKKNMNSISNLKTDASGKITEVELRKPL